MRPTIFHDATSSTALELEDDGTIASAATSELSSAAATQKSEELECQLFYRYVELPDPHAVVSQQQRLCEQLGLVGRMRIAHEGINGILCGRPTQLAKYREAMAAPGSPLHGLAVQYKISPAGEFDPMGGELYVRVTDEITATGEALKRHPPTALGGHGGTHLNARDFHAALHEADEEATGRGPARKQIVIDTRNHFETAVGHFPGAIDPKIRTFAQFPSWVDANVEQIEGADVLMYCTGGIRCVDTPLTGLATSRLDRPIKTILNSKPAAAPPPWC